MKLNSVDWGSGLYDLRGSRVEGSGIREEVELVSWMSMISGWVGRGREGFVIGRLGSEQTYRRDRLFFVLSSLLLSTLINLSYVE